MGSDDFRSFYPTESSKPLPLQKGDPVRFKKNQTDQWQDGYVVRYTQPENAVFVSRLASDHPEYSEKADSLELVKLFEGLLERKEIF